MCITECEENGAFMDQSALEKAINAAGGGRALAQAMGLSPMAVSNGKSAGCLLSVCLPWCEHAKVLLLHMNYGRTCQTYFHFQISTLGKQLSPSPPTEGGEPGRLEQHAKYHHSRPSFPDPKHGCLGVASLSTTELLAVTVG
ncbi:hypothetical protein ABFY62_31335 [Pseudomonas aeruginosa]|uniref:hypothetical protein n=1 Tax=Pseudomonas aeruginosa TaxID=287 RepID=UPI003D2A0DB2